MSDVTYRVPAFTVKAAWLGDRWSARVAVGHRCLTSGRIDPEQLTIIEAADYKTLLTHVRALVEEGFRDE